MSRIIIQLAGGLVADVFIQGNDIPPSAIVVDEDVEGADPKEITSVTIPAPIKLSKKESKVWDKKALQKATKDLDLGKVYEACIHTELIGKLPKNSDVDRIVKAYLKS